MPGRTPWVARAEAARGRSSEGREAIGGPAHMKEKPLEIRAPGTARPSPSPAIERRGRLGLRAQREDRSCTIS